MKWRRQKQKTPAEGEKKMRRRRRARRKRSINNSICSQAERLIALHKLQPKTWNKKKQPGCSKKKKGGGRRENEGGMKEERESRWAGPPATADVLICTRREGLHTVRVYVCV